MLADFRGWLTDLTSSEEFGQTEPARVDLFTLIAQFTALRHEVNLQTKAARAATEQTAEALKQILPTKPVDTTEIVRPLVKALVDVADALMIGVRQTESARLAAESLLAGVSTPPPQPAVGMWAKLFRKKPRSLPTEPGPIEQLGRLLVGLTDGYLMSLRRVERALVHVGVEPVPSEGRPFDPELMEVIEVVGADGQPVGTVMEEVRRGYRWNGALLRYAQVKVAR